MYGASFYSYSRLSNGSHPVGSGGDMSAGGRPYRAGTWGDRTPIELFIDAINGLDVRIMQLFARSCRIRKTS